MTGLLFIVACTSTSADSADARADTASAVDTARVVDTVGVAPDAPVPLPMFAATNMDETSRGPADLQGGPTVVWFYPAAGTYG
jgi:hypothetical protein